MPLKSQPPILYLITSGETTPESNPASKDFAQVLNLIEAAVTAKVNLLQLREKNLSARVLYELTEQGAKLVKDSHTQMLVNDRADIACAAGADGVHLTTQSLNARVVRNVYGSEFVIGVSTHSQSEIEIAWNESATFAVYGPVFETASKRSYGQPLGIASLRSSVSHVRPFPVLAIGGVTLDNVGDCFRAGAVGVAAIRLFQDPKALGTVVERIREVFAEIYSHGSAN